VSEEREAAAPQQVRPVHELLPLREGQVMGSQDQGVRRQIEAVKTHLLAEGLPDILEPPSSKEGYHSFRSTYDKRIRVLWISYQWLSDNPHPAAVVAYLEDKNVAGQQMTDTCTITIHDGGMVHGELCV
jgi:hypothetical protein